MLLIHSITLLLIYTVNITFASYCGQSAIPYSLEILSDGRPVLGCARPACFGWTAAGARAADPAQFYRVDGRADGFLRAGDVRGPTVRNASGFQPQYSICDRSYNSARCSGGSWVGGIAPASKMEAGEALRLMCCYYNKLAVARETGSVELHPGQIVDGGEVKNADGRTIGFEYVANLQRLVDRSGRVIYVATMKKFSCMPEPPVSSTIQDADAASFLINNIMQSVTTTTAATTTTTAVPRHELGFAQQTFDLPSSMPEEDAQILDWTDSNANEVSIPLKSSGVPSAKAMEDDEDSGMPPVQQMASQRRQNNEPPRNPAVSNGHFIDNSVIDGDRLHSKVTPQKYEQQRPYQQQQQQQSQQQFQQNNLLNPLGLFGYAPQWLVPTQQQQQQPQQQQPQLPSFNNFVLNQQQQQPKQQQQQNENPFASLFSLPTANVQNNKNGLQFANGDLPKEPLIEIPAPEEIDNMIPPNGRQLINNVARTLLSYFQ